MRCWKNYKEETAMISEKGFVLENGTELPFLGFGTYLVQEEKIILDA